MDGGLEILEEEEGEVEDSRSLLLAALIRRDARETRIRRLRKIPRRRCFWSRWLARRPNWFCRCLSLSPARCTMGGSTSVSPRLHRSVMEEAASPHLRLILCAEDIRIASSACPGCGNQSCSASIEGLEGGRTAGWRCQEEDVWYVAFESCE